MNRAFQYHRAIAGAVTMGALFVFVWRSPQLHDLGANHLDKFSHLIIFFVLGSCYINTASQGFKVLNLTRFLGGSAAALAFAVGIEILQHFIPWRSAELSDLIADFIGVFLALLFCLHIEQRIERARS